MTAGRTLPVSNYAGLYEITDHGSVRSLARTVMRSNGRGLTIPARTLKPFLRNGYWCVNLHGADGSMRTVQIHTLVLEHFVGPRPTGMEACHGPNRRDDNSLGNLRWDTHSANERDKPRMTKCRKGLHDLPDQPGNRRCAECYRDWYESRKAA